ncbi:unnamed protein product [Lathyrus oleraceus]
MSMGLNDVSYLPHLPVSGKLLDHGNISIDEALEMMVDYLGVFLEDSMRKFEKIIGAHTRFEFLKNVYTYEFFRAQEVRDGDEQLGLHKAYSMKACLLYLVGTKKFVGKSVTYTDVVYLQYFEDFEWIHENNWGTLVWSTCTQSY